MGNWEWGIGHRPNRASGISNWELNIGNGKLKIG
jgi:hypothetical protein